MHRSPLGAVVLVGTVALAGSLVAAWAFAEMTERVWWDDSLSPPDRRVLSWVVERRDEPWTSIARAITHLADATTVVVGVVVTTAVLLVRGHRRAAALAVASPVGAAVLTAVVKALVDRRRPTPGGRLVDIDGAAFPSGHAAQAVAWYGIVCVLVVWRLRSPAARLAAVLVAATVIVAIGLSRVYLAVHWPSDVVAGWALGTSWLCAVIGVAATVDALHTARSRDRSTGLEVDR